MDAKRVITHPGVKCKWHSNRIKYSELEKMKFISDGIQKNGSIAEYCHSNGISIEYFNKWKDDISQLALRKIKNDKSGFSQNEIVRFENENEHLKKLIDELEIENKLLKTRLKKGINNDLKLKLN